MAKNNLVYIVGIIVLIVVVGVAVIALRKSPTPSNTSTQATTIAGSTTTGQSYQSSSTTKHPVLMTDPAQVPPGTSAMVVTYTSVKVYATNGTTSGWVNAQGSGSVNLLATQSAAQVIGSANVTANSTIHAVSFDVTSVTATVNGTTRTVVVPNSTVTVNVTGSTKASSNSSVLIDFFPTVVTTSNSNSTVYAMSPSATAVLVSNATISSSSNVGSTVALNSNVNAQLNLAAPSIMIVSAKVSSSGNVTNTTVTVKNNANRTVIINGVVLYGNESASAKSNSSLNLSLGSGLLNVSVKAALQIQALKTIAFTTTSNGSLQTATTSGSWQASGYAISSGSSATFSFNGPVTYDSGSVNARVVGGTPYKVVVFGSGGATASTSATAGSS